MRQTFSGLAYKQHVLICASYMYIYIHNIRYVYILSTKKYTYTYLNLYQHVVYKQNTCRSASPQSVCVEVQSVCVCVEVHVNSQQWKGTEFVEVQVFTFSSTEIKCVEVVIGTAKNRRSFAPPTQPPPPHLANSQLWSKYTPTQFTYVSVGIVSECNLQCNVQSIISLQGDVSANVQFAM